jgi:kumamolisin
MTLLAFALSVTPGKAMEPMVALAGRISPAIASAQIEGSMDPSSTVNLAITLPTRNQAQLDSFLADLYNPSSPRYGKYVTAQEFARDFGPTQADYDAVAAYSVSNGLSVTGRSANRLILDVSGSPAAVEAAFGVHLNSYVRKDGTKFYAADSAAKVPASMIGKISGVAGLDNAFKLRPQYVMAKQPGGAGASSVMKPQFTGPTGYMSPSDIHKAYEASPVSFQGHTQRIGVFELSGFAISDPRHYASYFGLPAPVITINLIDGATNTPDGNHGDVEADLDIEVDEAVAPQANQYVVYIGPNTNQGVLDTYNKIATANAVKTVSTSWGLWEDVSDVPTMQAEYTIFQEMAAQGQSVFAASGDDGAYDPDTGYIYPSDPASQPYVTGVGGTSLYVNSDGSYDYETTWWDGTYGSGGGVSSLWGIPSYQASAIPFGTLGSWTARNVPDVAADADPDTGYAVYNTTSYGGWIGVGGTSAAAPLWAAYTAIANQVRGIHALGNVGFANPMLYNLNYTGYYFDMHDITINSSYDGTGNGYYYCEPNYDPVTGLGTGEWYDLIFEMTQAPTGYAPPVTPAGATATVLTHTSVKVTWTKSIGAKYYYIYRYPGPGSPPLLATTGGTATSYTDTTVKHGTSYDYGVKAVNAGGYSGYAFTSSVTP